MHPILDQGARRGGVGAVLEIGSRLTEHAAAGELLELAVRVNRTITAWLSVAPAVCPRCPHLPAAPSARER